MVRGSEVVRMIIEFLEEKCELLCMEMGRMMGEADWKAAEIRHSTWDMLSLRYLLEIQMEISDCRM